MSSELVGSDQPPAFGHATLPLFGLEPGHVFLNHGSYGAVPRPVQKWCSDHAEKVEANPGRYYRSGFQQQHVEARRRLSEIIGAHVDECVFVPNTTAGVNTILRNIEWEAQDILIQGIMLLYLYIHEVTYHAAFQASTTFHGTISTMQYISDVRPHPTIETFEISFPATHTAIIASFKKYIKDIKAKSQAAQSGIDAPKAKILALIDSIVSHPAVYLPWKEMVKICREEGVLSLVDAAHSVGQEMGLNLNEVQPDFFVSSLHKWLYTWRSCGVLYVPFRNQHLIKSAVPTSGNYISPKDIHGGPATSNKFVMQHLRPGRTNYAPYLSVSVALDFRAWLGGEEAINKYCNKLAVDGGKLLAETLGTTVMDDTPDHELTLNMINVELPISGQSDSSHGELADSIEVELMDKWHILASIYPYVGKLWVRCSAQIYNDVSKMGTISRVVSSSLTSCFDWQVSDFEHLAEALVSICGKA